MKYKISFTIALCLILFGQISAQKDKEVPIPSPSQFVWQNAELAALVCWDMHVFDGEFYVQSKARITPVKDYNTFNPQKYDMDQWIKSLKDAGFKIAIFTVSHETGFFFHQSDATPYSMKALKWQEGKGDILQDFKESCEKYGLLPGVYIGTRWNAFYGVHNFMVNGDNQFSKNRQQHYNTMIENVTEEIFSNYGDWAIVWFDGGAHGPGQGGPDVLSVFEKYQKNCLFYHNLQRADMRWGGSESGTVPYPCWGTFQYPTWFKKADGKNGFKAIKHGDPNGNYYMPAMSDAPLRGNGGHDWFWEPNQEHIIYPLDKLVNMYYNSVGHNTTLILGVTPNAEGLLPQPDVDRLKEFGSEIKRRFSNPIATISGQKKELKLKLPKRQMVNQIVLMEDISKGERVRKFVIEGKTENGWKTIFKGSCIGHKFIHKFEGIEVSSLRLNIKETNGEPSILGFKVFNIRK